MTGVRLQRGPLREWLLGVTTFLLHQFAAKNLVRSSQKCEKEEKAEKLKLKKVKWNEMKTLFMCLAFMTANGGHRLSTLVINIFNKKTRL